MGIIAESSTPISDTDRYQIDEMEFPIGYTLILEYAEFRGVRRKR